MNRTLLTALIILAGAGVLTLAFFYVLPEKLDPLSLPQEFVPIDELPQMGLISRSPEQPRAEEGTFYIGRLSVEGEYRLRSGSGQKACFLADEKYVPDLPEKERAFCFTNTNEAFLLFDGSVEEGCFEGRAEITFEGLFVSRVGESEAKLLEVISLAAQRETPDCP